MENDRQAEAELPPEVMVLRKRLARRDSEDGSPDGGTNWGELILDELPYPSMLIRRDRTILAANLLAREMGSRIGGICWRDFGRAESIPELHKRFVEQHAGNVPAGGSQCLFCRAEEALANETPLNDPEVDVLGKNRSLWWIPVEDDVFLYCAIDTTDQKRAKEIALDSAGHYRSLFDNAPMPMWEEDFSEVRRYLEELAATGVLDLAAHILDNPEEVVRCAAEVTVVDVNLAALKMFGASRAEEFHNDLSFALGQDSYETFRDVLLALWRGDAMHEAETVARTAAGDSIHIRFRRSIVPGHRDTWSRVIASVTDITDQAVAEERSRAILESIEEGYFESDHSGNITFFNEAWCGMLGYSSEELLRMGSRRYLGEETAPKVLAVFNEVFRTGKTVTVSDWQLVGKDGVVVHVEASVLPRKDWAGQTIGFRGITRNIAERKRTEDEKSVLIRELQSASAQVRILEGLIPICAVCKKVRDDDGDWKQIEVYIEDSSEARFSHGYCPECAKKAETEVAERQGCTSAGGD